MSARHLTPTSSRDRKSTRLNSSHTEIYTLSLHDALPIWLPSALDNRPLSFAEWEARVAQVVYVSATPDPYELQRSEEHTSELQSHRDLHSFPTRRSSDLAAVGARQPSSELCRVGGAGRAGRLCQRDT